MRVANVNGLVTLFYDGSKVLYNSELHNEWDYSSELHNEWVDILENIFDLDSWEEWNLSDRCKRYWKERQTWQQVIILDGVTVIPEKTFHGCKKITRVIFADTVVRIKTEAIFFRRQNCFAILVLN